MIKKINECFAGRAAIFTRNLVRFVNSIDQYISESTHYSSLSFENFRTLFAAYFVFGCALLFVGLAGFIVQTLKPHLLFVAAAKSAYRSIADLISDLMAGPIADLLSRCRRRQAN